MSEEKNKYDTDQDGILSAKEIELENRDRKEDQQRRMAWVAMISMVVFTGFLVFTNFVEVERIDALSNALEMFYIAQAGIVATFFGTSAWVTRGW